MMSEDLFYFNLSLGIYLSFLLFTWIIVQLGKRKRKTMSYEV